MQIHICLYPTINLKFNQEKKGIERKKASIQPKRHHLQPLKSFNYLDFKMTSSFSFFSSSSFPSFSSIFFNDTTFGHFTELLLIMFYSLELLYVYTMYNILLSFLCKISLCRSGSPQIHWDLPVSAPWVLVLKGHHHKTQHIHFLIISNPYSLPPTLCPSIHLLPNFL